MHELSLAASIADLVRRHARSEELAVEALEVEEGGLADASRRVKIGAGAAAA